MSSAITLTDKEGVPHTSRIGPAACAAGGEYIPQGDHKEGETVGDGV